MAESDQGIHPEVMRHIVDLHRKHSELQMQMHDKDSGEESGHMEHLTKCIDENTAAVKEQTNLMRELITAIREDVKADKAVAEGERGKRKQPGA